MKNKSGFSLPEIMIVVVIIGLLAAMAIPAFEKVKYKSIKDRVDKGVIVSSHEWEYYYKRKIESQRGEKNKDDIVIPPQKQTVEQERSIVEKKIIRIDGKLYEIIPLE